MTPISHVALSPRMVEAVTEIKALIRDQYPEATFDIGQGEDPEGVYLTATVDVDDRGEVIDLFLDRLVDLQVEEGLPLFVVPVRTPARTAAILAQEPPIPGTLLVP